MQKLEKDVERKFIKLMAEEGWSVLKFTPMGSRGWPDRVVLLPGGHAVFVELKRPGKEPAKLQKHQIRVLRKMGYRAGCFDRAEEAAHFVRSAHRKFEREA